MIVIRKNDCQRTNYGYGNTPKLNQCITTTYTIFFDNAWCHVTCRIYNLTIYIKLKKKRKKKDKSENEAIL